jgi:two-component sensor histidine kinase
MSWNVIGGQFYTDAPLACSLSFHAPTPWLSGAGRGDHVKRGYAGEGVMQTTNFRDQFTNIADACALAQSIVDTVREPVLVLDKGLRVIAASRSFYSQFKVRPEDTQGRLLYALGDGQWDIPKLRVLLEKIIPEHGVMEGYEVEHDFPGLGHRTMYLNARQVLYKEGAETTILLGIEDVTERRLMEHDKDEFLRQKEVMLVELQHRIANSLQIIAGIILLKAQRVDSEETRAHLQDAHKRVISIAAVQEHLHASGIIGPIDMVPYLSKLCTALTTSMIGDNRPVTIKVLGKGGTATSREAECLGLVATELVMNALKHAFPSNKIDGRIVIAYDVDGSNWKLSVADNGIGKPDGVFAQPKTGLGTGIVKALAQQLGAKVETLSDPEGTTVSITHATFWTKENRAA